MRRSSVGIFLAIAVLSITAFANAQPSGATPAIEQGSFTVHLLLHAIGEEHFWVTRGETPGTLTMESSFVSSDRGMKRTITSSLLMNQDYTPLKLEQKSTGSTGPTTTQLAEISGNSASIREGEKSRTVTLPPSAFLLFGTTPASEQMMMMRYWKAHHQPTKLPILRADPLAPALEIKLVVPDTLSLNGVAVHLQRYIVANLMFGREILWLDDHNQLAATMTFAGGLPQEEILPPRA